MDGKSPEHKERSGCVRTWTKQPDPKGRAQNKKRQIEHRGTLRIYGAMSESAGRLLALGFFKSSNQGRPLPHG